MKNNILYLASLIFIIIVSCISENKLVEGNSNQYYVENKLSFFDPYEIVYSYGKYQGNTYQEWLRRPENLKMIHETFKKIGYDKLISEYELTSNPCLIWGYVKRPLNHLIDSLVLTYSTDTIETKYYREFWLRRQNEGNKDIVFEILKEVSQVLIDKETVDYDETFVNDTLYSLVIIDKTRDKITREQALSDFEYLKSIGMHGSAYNLLFENYKYQDIDLDKNKLVLTLKSDSVNCCPRTWIIDNTK